MTDYKNSQNKRTWCAKVLILFNHLRENQRWISIKHKLAQETLREDELICELKHVLVQPNLEGYEIHEVPLIKKDGQSLGISIVGCNPLTSQGETRVKQQLKYTQTTKCSKPKLTHEQPGQNRTTEPPLQFRSFKALEFFHFLLKPNTLLLCTISLIIKI